MAIGMRECDSIAILQGKHMSKRLCSQLILLLVFMSLLPLTALAQDEAKTGAPLELRLTTVTPSLCIDSPLKLELEVVNVSFEDVLLDTSKVWGQFSYSHVASSDYGDRNGGGGIGYPRPREQNIVLQPGMTYRSTHEFSLAFNFFQSPGNYTLMTLINSIFSNEVKFELYDCGKTQKIEDQQ